LVDSTSELEYNQPQRGQSSELLFHMYVVEPSIWRIKRPTELTRSIIVLFAVGATRVCEMDRKKMARQFRFVFPPSFISLKSNIYSGPILSSLAWNILLFDGCREYRGSGCVAEHIPIIMSLL
jgi:hypothetical protein